MLRGFVRVSPFIFSPSSAISPHGSREDWRGAVFLRAHSACVFSRSANIANAYSPTRPLPCVALIICRLVCLRSNLFSFGPFTAHWGRFRFRFRCTLRRVHCTNLIRPSRAIHIASNRPTGCGRIFPADRQRCSCCQNTAMYPLMFHAPQQIAIRVAIARSRRPRSFEVATAHSIFVSRIDPDYLVIIFGGQGRVAIEGDAFDNRLAGSTPDGDDAPRFCQRRLPARNCFFDVFGQPPTHLIWTSESIEILRKR